MTSTSLTAEIKKTVELQASIDKTQQTVENNYEKLKNLPSVNGITLTGNKSFEDLGEVPISNTEISRIYRLAKGT